MLYLSVELMNTTYAAKFNLNIINSITYIKRILKNIFLKKDMLTVKALGTNYVLTKRI